MRYMLLIYEAPDAGPKPGTPEFDAMMGGYYAFSEQTAKAGVMLAGDPLQGRETATTLRVRRGDRMVTDGPFAETKEVLGGYYILNCKDLDEALGYAAKIPSAAWGSVEVRPIAEMGDMAPDPRQP